MSVSALDALDLARLIADELLEQGALAVWLAGSHARGDAGPHSDIDVGALADAPGAGRGYRLTWRAGHLVSVAWTTPEQTRASFDDPTLLGAAVPGWRNAVVLRDPHGVASALRELAASWRWTESRTTACDAWVAEQVTGYAEEVHKLVGALERRAASTAAVQRSVLALRLPWIMSVHRRVLYDSENVALDLVAAELGEPWASTQAAALALGGEPLAASSRAALRLYALATAEVAPLLDARQRSVVEHAAHLAETAAGLQ